MKCFLQMANKLILHECKVSSAQSLSILFNLHLDISEKLIFFIGQFISPHLARLGCSIYPLL